MSYYDYCDFSELSDFSELNGKVFDSVTSTDKEVIFKCGSVEYKLHHFQNCCENVYVEDIVGDLADLVDSEILHAEETSSHENPKTEEYGYVPNSFTWTFYHLRTMKGSVTIRFYGTSNGYYSERVMLTKKHF